MLWTLATRLSQRQQPRRNRQIGIVGIEAAQQERSLERQVPQRLPQRPDDASTRALTRELVQWAAALLAEGAPLALRLPGRIGWELRLVVQGGLRILEKIAAMDYASIRTRPRLRRSDAPGLLWRALRMT